MDNNITPTLSIGLPVYNGEHYLPETIDSLLAQSYTDFELIISDNASTDSTREICQRYAEQDARIKYCRSETNRGAAWNFNNTVDLARGKYFKWAAHDDLHHPDFVKKCIEVLDTAPSVVLCFTYTNFIDEHGNDLGEYKFPVDVLQVPCHKLFLVYAGGGHIVHEVFGVIRTDTLRKTALIGGYVGSDLVLLGQLALAGRFYQVPECLFFHREHPQRSTIATGGDQGFTRWYDASRSAFFVMPYWRRLLENTKSVLRGPIACSEKARCMVEILRSINWNRGAYLQDVKNAAGMIFRRGK